MARQSSSGATVSSSELLQLAETHLRRRNFSLCRQYSLQSQHDPARASQLISISDILSTVSTPPPTNWYSVLQIDTFSDDLTLISSNFKNLTHQLENSSLPLAEEALGSIFEAYETLSDPTRKARLDSQLRNDHVGGEDDCFWTFCPYCFYVYQYFRVYEGCCLRCQNVTCKRPFHGVSLSSLPRMELDKGQYFGCFGYFPIGFLPSEGKDGNGKRKFESWSPLVGLFPVRRVGKTRASRVDQDNSNVHCVEIMDDSDESETPPNDNQNEHFKMNVDAASVHGIKPRMMRKKTVAFRAKSSMCRGRNNEGASMHEDETYGSSGDMHDVGMGSGCDLDAEDVKFFEEDGEIFVGLSPDDAL